MARKTWFKGLIELAGLPRLPDDVVGWLYRVVRNKAISALRSTQRRRQHESDAAARQIGWFEGSAADAMDARVAAIALESLPIEQREVVVARIWGGLSFQQIGRLVGASDTRRPSALRSGLIGFAKEVEGAMSEKPIDGELAAVEAALSTLRPTASALQRDRLMFLAGRASAGKTVAGRPESSAAYGCMVLAVCDGDVAFGGGHVCRVVGRAAKSLFAL